MDTRLPAVEGRFYPGTEREIVALIEQIEKRERYAETSIGSKDVIGAILPHAGHIYSGYQTIPFFKYLNKEGIVPETFIILNPNHSGYGDPIATDEHRYWKNSMGILEIDKEISGLLPYREDASAHSREHSCEVIIPFIQYFFKDVNLRILPISMIYRSAAESEKLGSELYKAVNDTGRKVVIIASSDFSHFQTAKYGYQQDQHILDQIAQRNIKGVEEVAGDYQISACGTGPIMALMAYSALISRDYKTKILARGHSGEVSPSDSVVDYISMLFYQ